MTPSQALEHLQANPSVAISAIIRNNPQAVAEKAIGLGIFTRTASPEELVQAVNELLRQGDTQTAIRMLSVPFNPNADNETRDYAPVLELAQVSKLR